MKKQAFKIWGIILSAAVALVGCGADPYANIVYPDAPDQSVVEKYLTLEELQEESINVSNEYGSAVFGVYSDTKWEITTQDQWLTLNTKKGYMYTDTKITFSKNPKDVIRTGTLTIWLNDADNTIYSISVKQEPSPTEIFLSQEMIEYSLVSGTQKVGLTTNADTWSAKVVDESGNTVDWCEVDPARGSGNSDLEVKVLNTNNTGDYRKAKLLIEANSISAFSKISQNFKVEAPNINLTDDYQFKLDWENIAGATYVLDVAKDENFTELLSVDAEGNNIEILAGSEEYNLEAIKYYDPSSETPDSYTGMIYVRLNSVLTVDGEVFSEASNVISTHNYYDNESGDGSEGSEFIVTNARHLKNVGKNLAGHFKQTADIDLTEIDDFKPIHLNYTNNIYSGLFTGVYDAGKGNVVDAETGRTDDQYKILNLCMPLLADSHVALFSEIGVGGIVRNINMEGVDISGKKFVAAIAGSIKMGKIISCHTTGDNSKINAAGEKVANLGSYTGGIVGSNMGGEISYCVNNATVNAASGAMVGGITGEISFPAEAVQTLISHCVNKGTVSIKAHSPLGGIVGNTASAVGATSNMIVEDSYNEGTIRGEQPNNQVGGIIGRATNTKITIRRSYNIGAISANGSAGGIIGRGGDYTRIEDCFNSGSVESFGTSSVDCGSNAGGIVATALPGFKTQFEMVRCHNIGAVTSNVVGQASGLFQHVANGAAKQEITMESCYALDATNSKQEPSFNTEILDPSTSYTNLSEADMKDQTKFDGWDFENTWTIEADASYPTLK